MIAGCEDMFNAPPRRSKKHADADDVHGSWRSEKLETSSPAAFEYREPQTVMDQLQLYPLGG